MKKLFLAFGVFILLFLGIQVKGVFAQSMPGNCIESHAGSSFDACVGSGNYTICSTTGTASVAGATYCCPGTITCPGSSAQGTITGTGTGAITCADGKSINTAIGCIPIDSPNGLIGFFLSWGIGIGGGIALLLIIFAGFQIMTSRGDPNRLKTGQELMTSAIAGLLLLIFSVVVLRIIGLDILNLPGFLK